MTDAKVDVTTCQSFVEFLTQTVQLAAFAAHALTVQRLDAGQDVEHVRLVAGVHAHWIAQTAQFVLKAQLLELVQTAHVLQLVDAEANKQGCDIGTIILGRFTVSAPSNKIARNVQKLQIL